MTKSRRGSLHVVRVEWTRGPPTRLWTQLTERLLTDSNNQRPAQVLADSQRAEEDTDDKCTL